MVVSVRGSGLRTQKFIYADGIQELLENSETYELDFV